MFTPKIRCDMRKLGLPSMMRGPTVKGTELGKPHHFTVTVYGR